MILSRTYRFLTFPLIFTVAFYTLFLQSSISIAQEEEGTVTLKIVVVNPVDAESQIIPLKEYLPIDITPEQIVKMGDLLVDYDPTSFLYYVHKDLEMAPGETQIFTIVIRDIWTIGEEKLTHLEKRIGEAFTRLKHAKHADRRARRRLKKETITMLDTIRKSQEQKYSDVVDRIKAYQRNSGLLEKVAFNVQTLEIMLSEDERAVR